MSLEQEIKLVVNSEQKINLASLASLMALADHDVESSHLVSTYYDTADLYLSKKKLGLRLRQHDKQWWQTVKTAGVVKEGLHQRDEWEYPLQGPQWDLSTLRQTPLADMIENTTLWSSLAPLFTTDFVRDSWQLTLADNSQVELAYDFGEVRAGDQSCSIHEIELELKSGDVESLNQLAKLLRSQFDVAPSNCSKAKMGYDLVAVLAS